MLVWIIQSDRLGIVLQPTKRLLRNLFLEEVDLLENEIFRNVSETGDHDAVIHSVLIFDSNIGAGGMRNMVEHNIRKVGRRFWNITTSLISMNVLLVSFVLRVLSQYAPLLVTRDYSNKVRSWWTLPLKLVVRVYYFKWFHSFIHMDVYTSR